MINKHIYIIVIIFLFIINCNKQSNNRGYDLYIKHACNSCHSLDGSRMNGPTFKGIYGKKIEFYNGDFIIADNQYLINSIIEPQKEIVKGYPDLMPAYVLSEDEINFLINFIKKQ